MCLRLNNSANHFLIQTYLFLHLFFSQAYSLFLKIIGGIRLVYFFDGRTTKNITHYYYLSIIPKKYSSGKYFFYILKPSDNEYFSYIGILRDLANKPMNNKEKVKRKEVIISDESGIINFDLKHIDNYYENMATCSNEHIFTFDELMSCFGKKCLKVKIITMNPYKIEEIDAYQLSLKDLYYYE